MAEDRGTGQHTFRIMTWNLHGAARPDLLAVTRAVADADPDVLALQEVRRSQATRVADLLGIEHTRWLRKHRPLGPLGSRWAEGIAVLSRFPVRAGADALLSRGAPLRSYRRRVLQEVTVTTAAGAVRVVNTHLSSDDDGGREVQAGRAAMLLAVPTGGAGIDRTVLVGDLNTADADEVIGVLTRVGLVDGLTSDGLGLTNPADVPTQRIDHVMAGSGLVIDDVRVPRGGAAWAALSDHLPVVADILAR